VTVRYADRILVLTQKANESPWVMPLMSKLEILRSVSFGQRVAEEETDELATYFVETDQWIRLFGGEIDIIYGPKGSGKSALYSLLQAKAWELHGRNVVLIPAENPRGATAFKNLTADPPVSEREFIGLWKLYIASLLHNALSEFKVISEPARELERALTKEGLVKGSMNLSALLQKVVGYIRSAFRPKSVEGPVELDPYSGLPKDFTGKISFSESGLSGQDDAELRSVDKLLDLEPVINFIPLESKKYRTGRWLVTMEVWETRVRLAIPAM
jgi:hypothetical protein